MSEYDVFADIYDLQYEEVVEDIAFFVEEAQKAQPPVLELACGTGRVTIPIAQAGIGVVGLDRSPKMLEVARRKVEALDEATRGRIELVQADMRDFALDREFSSFHLLTTPEDRKRALANIRRHLADDGKLIIDLFVPDLSIIAAHSGPLGEPLKRFLELDNPCTGHRIVVWDTRRYDHFQQMIHTYMIYEELDEEGRAVAKTYRPLKLCSIFRYEMPHLLELCGYEVVNVYGGFDRRPLDEKSKEMIWVARKSVA